MKFNPISEPEYEVWGIPVFVDTFAHPGQCMLLPALTDDQKASIVKEWTDKFGEPPAKSRVRVTCEDPYFRNPQFSYGPTIGAPNLLEQAFDHVHDGLGKISDTYKRDSARRSLAYIYDMAKIGAKTPARPFKPVKFSQQEEPWTAKREISAFVEVDKPDRHGHVVLPHTLTLCFKTAETVTLESPEEDLAKLTPEHREMLESGQVRAIVTKLEQVVEQ